MHLQAGTVEQGDLAALVPQLHGAGEPYQGYVAGRQYAARHRLAVPGPIDQPPAGQVHRIG